MDKRAEKVSNVFVLIGIAIFSLFVMFGAADVLNRLAVGSSLTFCQQTEVWLNLFLVFVIAPVLVIEDTHISVKFLIDKFKGRTRKVIDNLNHLALIVFCVFTIWAGVEYTLYTRAEGITRAMGVAYFPYWIITASLPVGMFLVLLASVYVYILTFRRQGGK